MASNPQRVPYQTVNPYPPEGEALTVSYLKDGQFLEVDPESLANLTVRELCNKPFVFRFNTNQGRVYFSGSEEPFLKLKREGRDVRWLHDLIEYWHQDLILRGFPCEASVYHWRLRDISILQKALIVFPDHQGMEVRQ